MTNRITPSHFVKVIAQNFSAAQVDESFAGLLLLWKKYGRHDSLKMILSSQAYDECPFILCHFLTTITKDVTIGQLKKYRNTFRSVYDTSYVSITTLWEESIASLISQDYLKQIENDVPNVNIKKTHRSAENIWVKIIYNNKTYFRSIDHDIDILMKHIS